MAGIELNSEAFSDHTMIPRRYTREGEDISPPLSWSGVPEGAAELVLFCEDPDAPTGSFVHWLVTGIEPTASGTIGPDETPPGGNLKANGFGTTGWGGPFPPAGDDAHRYFFRLYALPRPVDMPEFATARDVHRAVDEQQMMSGTLVGMYQR